MTSNRKNANKVMSRTRSGIMLDEEAEVQAIMTQLLSSIPQEDNVAEARREAVARIPELRVEREMPQVSLMASPRKR